ncbi:type I-C CRISPR-associated protein Cas8c/Csd1 [Paenibacillus sp. SAF-054]|uniref:type I-C CRISPR-associated protein Cas8c/Csd1 n=1 Tax=unclassified Paenibacillus TaxID=185978 RepID=UPI003F8204B3
MSWLLNLYETYESNLDRVGEIEKKSKDREYTLLPVSHTTQNAHVEVEITEDGEFHSAFVIEKNDMNTLIPSTEKSASRAGAVISPYPLHDKLSYVAGDFKKYGGKIKGEEPFLTYIQELQNWAESPYAHSKVKSIYRYLSKGQLIRDLVTHRILCVDEQQQLVEKWDKKYEALYPEKPAIFSVLAGEQESAFIRFNVYSPERMLTKVWKDPEMYDSFINYYRERLGDEDLCFVTGRTLPSTDKHANKIRNPADKAKLISANDTSGFTFRGRFKESRDAASISYDVSQKAHNALKWLIQRQGKFIEQRVFLVWGNDVLDLPDPTEDAFSLDFDQDIVPKVAIKSNTNQSLAAEHAKALTGYSNKLVPHAASNFKSEANILVLDSATTGRMAVLYYRNMNKELYLEKLAKWHSTCVWLHRYRKNEDGVFVEFRGAPATKDIAFAAYGPRAGDKIVKGLMERMLPCVIDGAAIPQDIVKSAFHRASNPVSMEKWEWEKTLSIACALINHKEGFRLALDVENEHRDYLFGRLLAVADVLERQALGRDEQRATNAVRYMNAFSKHPERTWNIIQQNLQVYQAKLGAKAIYLSKIIDEIGSKFKADEFNNKPLSGKYLLGFYSQRHELYQKKDKTEDAEPASQEER